MRKSFLLLAILFVAPLTAQAFPFAFWKANTPAASFTCTSCTVTTVAGDTVLDFAAGADDFVIANYTSGKTATCIMCGGAGGGGTNVGAGGAGGGVIPVASCSVTLTNGTYHVVVGTGGARGNGGDTSDHGTVTTFNGQTAGYGGFGNDSTGVGDGGPGNATNGNGGGGRGSGGNGGAKSGSGFAGGAGDAGAGGGGGGAGGAGGNASIGTGGTKGSGVTDSIRTGSSETWGEGGAGAGTSSGTPSASSGFCAGGRAGGAATQGLVGGDGRLVIRIH